MAPSTAEPTTAVPPTSILPTIIPATLIPTNLIPTSAASPTVAEPTTAVFTEPPPSATAGSDGLITICHYPPGNPANAHTITVSLAELPAHLAHGDSLGQCSG